MVRRYSCGCVGDSNSREADVPSCSDTARTSKKRQRREKKLALFGKGDVEIHTGHSCRGLLVSKACLRRVFLLYLRVLGTRRVSDPPPLQASVVASTKAALC